MTQDSKCKWRVDTGMHWAFNRLMKSDNCNALPSSQAVKASPWYAGLLADWLMVRWLCRFSWDQAFGTPWSSLNSWRWDEMSSGQQEGDVYGPEVGGWKKWLMWTLNRSPAFLGIQIGDKSFASHSGLNSCCKRQLCKYLLFNCQRIHIGRHEGLRTICRI